MYTIFSLFLQLSGEWKNQEAMLISFLWELYCALIMQHKGPGAWCAVEIKTSIKQLHFAKSTHA